MVPAIGYALREQNRAILNDPAIDAVEITFERADDPLRLERYIGDLEFDHVSVHCLKLSIASPDTPDWKYVDAIRAVAAENGADSISDHLGFTRDGNNGHEMGHFAAPPWTPAALDCTSRNVDRLQEAFGARHFYVETIANLFEFKGTMSEAEFVRRLLERTGCGWLLDVTNVYANARNFNFCPREFVDEVMSGAERVQMHLAGGVFDDEAGMYIDSHSDPVPDDVWGLYRYALEQAGDRVTAVFIERDQNFPDDNGWLEEIHEARRIAEDAASVTRT